MRSSGERRGHHADMAQNDGGVAVEVRGFRKEQDGQVGKSPKALLRTIVENAFVVDSPQNHTPGRRFGYRNTWEDHGGPKSRRIWRA